MPSNGYTAQSFVTQDVSSVTVCGLQFGQMGKMTHIWARTIWVNLFHALTSIKPKCVCLTLPSPSEVPMFQPAVSNLARWKTLPGQVLSTGQESTHSLSFKIRLLRAKCILYWFNSYIKENSFPRFLSLTEWFDRLLFICIEVARKTAFKRQWWR